MNWVPKAEDFLTKASEFSAKRPAILSAYKSSYAQARAKLDEDIAKDPRRAGEYRIAYAKITDDLIISIFQLFVEYVNPLTSPTTSERLSLVAVGGYGRMEMAPFSDIDLLFLIPYKPTAWHETIIENFLYFCWDMGLKIGQSTRSLDECHTLATQDITIRTSLLEKRFLAGDQEQFKTLSTQMRTKLFDKSIPDFVEAKLDERENRHQKSGNARYILEPNVKEAKGGLRDLQTLYWLGKYITGVNEPRELVKEGLFYPEEYQVFADAEDFLWMVRIHLHLIARRANDILSFDMQVEIADRLGYADREGRRGVETFMQDYFRAARQVGELTRVFLTELEARHVRGPRFRWPGLGGKPKLPGAFTMENDRINFSSEAALTDHPLNMLRIFVHALENDILIHPNAFRLMARHHELIDDKFRQNKEANRIFLSLILDYGNPERVLRRMNEVGVLGAFIPAWARIDAMMQFNMYHSYTVDEHTIRCISNLHEIESGNLIEDLPIASGILSAGVNRKVIYIALLLHDIGKGMPRPHEIEGAEIAQLLAPRLGLEAYECELVEWLVRFHLEMSDAAQKRDLSDPQTILSFADLVETQERLDLLTVLTVCDIRGVGPDIWNNWKAQLLRDLHRITSTSLSHAGQIDPAAARETAAKEALKIRLKSWSVDDINFEIERHYTAYWLGLSAHIHAEIARLMRKSTSNGLRLSFAADPDRDATRVCVVAPDHPGLFARLCGAFSLSGAGIVDARSYTTSDGMATDVFWVQDSEGSCYDPSKQNILRRNVLKILRGEVITRDAMASRAKIKKRERDFDVPTKIHFDNKGSNIFTIIEIDTRDRLGLLFDLARILSDANISIYSAIIATYGEQAVDSFYVKDLFGLKIQSPAKQEQIKAKLLAAIDRGFEEALS